MTDRLSALAFGLSFLALPVLAAPPWTVDYDASKLGFTAQQGEEKFTGGFKQFAADIRFSPDDLAHSKITVTVETGSAFAGAPERDDVLPTRNWFDVARFPQALFETQSITATGKDSYLASGKLTLRGISQDVALPFTLTQEQGKTHAAGEVTIQRNVFGIGQGEFTSDGLVKYPVAVQVDIWAVPAP